MSILDYFVFMFKSYEPIAEALCSLLHPHAEVVIHDLKTNKIAAIFNPLSKRQKGDESLIEDIGDYSILPDVFPVYAKRNWDGRTLKSVSATLRDKKGSAIGLLCINLDISMWEDFSHHLQGWLSRTSQPDVLFKDDWREKINVFVSNYLQEQRTSLKCLSKNGKIDLVKELHREGAFSAKHAAAYIAEVLQLSRATIYNYLRQHHE